ncbi:hypothetical protein [Kineosporia babensis]|uniref:Uncharacterized protein n=1 Tax=Kineosporia babensis TaxID=499548 RepID=A0A9X1NB82_9ACTN|nr:hypothetical protein [Kineosporia babensis]MCD5310910.1 hypothetical protein [Kineosporia babensis]
MSVPALMAGFAVGFALLLIVTAGWLGLLAVLSVAALVAGMRAVIR